MKKKKILNVRKSLIASGLALTVALAGLGIHLGNKNAQSEDPAHSSDPNPSPTIIENGEHNHGTELPGGVIIDPSGPEITDPAIEEPTETSQIGEGEQPVENNQNKPIGGNNETGTSTTPTGTENPTGPTDPIEVIPGHVHILGSWVSINDVFEGSYCPEDGELVGTRLHHYVITDSGAITNNDGTHNIYITGTCTNCGHTKTRTFNNLDCNYGEEITWDSVFEYETCETCGYEHTLGRHKFNNGVVKGNQIVYSCVNDNCDYTLSRPYNPDHNHGGSGIDTPAHTHYLGEWVSISDDLEANYCPEDGTLMGTRSHKYIQTDYKVISNNNGTHNLVNIETCINCNHVKTTTTNNVSCTFGPEVIVGNQYVSTCTECGYEKTRPYTPEHTHNWSEWTTTKSPTCTETGIKTRTCSCGEKEIETIPALGHSYGEWTVVEDWHVVTKPDGTKVEQRALEQICSECGNKNTKTETRPYNPSHTHSWSEWATTKAPTCTETGVRTRTCSCGETETETIPALGHDMGAFTTTKLPTCTEKGIETSTCSRCGHTETREIDALGHSYSEWTVTEDWHVVTKPDGTQVEERTLEQVCTVCGNKNTKTEERPYNPSHTHSWSEWATTKEPTCTEAGERTRTCSCGETETREIDALGHNESLPDSSGDIICTECGAFIRNVGPILPPITEHTHNWSEWTTTKEPTCTEAGERTRTCTADGCIIGTETETISALGHNESAPDSSGDIICTECGTFIRNVGPILPPLPGITEENKTADQALDTIIEIQNQAAADANANADKQLDNLLNSGANAAEMDESLNKIIEDQNKAKADAAAAADEQLNEIIASIEDAKVSQIIENQDKTIEAAKQNAEAKLEAIISSDADAAAKDAALDLVIEETERVIGAATAQADAELAALAGTAPATAVVRELVK